MDGEKRREEILEKLKKDHKPVSATALGKEFNVSRQIVVGDIALLRAMGQNIIATNTGYILGGMSANTSELTLRLRFKTEDAYDVLCTIVDEGVKIIETYIEHSAYGRITVPLNISNRSEIRSFSEKLIESGDKSLGTLTGNTSYMKVTSESQLSIIRMQKALNEKGYLLKS